MNLLQQENTPLSVAEIAQKMGANEEIESIYKILRHLHSNGRGVVLTGNFGQPSSLQASWQ